MAVLVGVRGIVSLLYGRWITIILYINFNCRRYGNYKVVMMILQAVSASGVRDIRALSVYATRVHSSSV